MSGKRKISCHIQAFSATSSRTAPHQPAGWLIYNADLTLSFPTEILQWLHGEIPTPCAQAPACPAQPHLSRHTEPTALHLPQPTFAHVAPLLAPLIPLLCLADCPYSSQFRSPSLPFCPLLTFPLYHPHLGLEEHSPYCRILSACLLHCATNSSKGTDCESLIFISLVYRSIPSTQMTLPPCLLDAWSFYLEPRTAGSFREMTHALLWPWHRCWGSPPGALEVGDRRGTLLSLLFSGTQGVLSVPKQLYVQGVLLKR